MFILSSDWDSSNNPNAIVEAHAKYDAYLKQNQSSFPASAYEFAIADWHHDFSNHKALHDSLLANLTVTEMGKFRERSVKIEISLLGAFQDGHLNLVYENVSSYQVGSSALGHTTIDRDEIRLSGTGNVLHEIVWRQSTKWFIECGDIKANWVPL